MRRVQTRGAGGRDQQTAQQRTIVQLGGCHAGQFGNQMYHSDGLRRPHGTHDNPIHSHRKVPSARTVTISRGNGLSISPASLAPHTGTGVISVMARPTLFTLPNLVSSSRVALAVGFVAFDAVPTRLALIGIASLTDFLDGWIARRTKVVSRFGALLDPVADRFFVLGVVISYVIGGQFNIWQAVAIMFRDVMSVIGFFVARNVSWLRPIPFKARWIGKAVTGAQLITFLAVLILPRIVDVMVIIVAALGIAATIDYTLMLWRERVRSAVTP